MDRPTDGDLSRRESRNTELAQSNQDDEVKINRKVITQTTLYNRLDDESSSIFKSNWFGLRGALQISSYSPISWLLKLIPILDWLPKYKWKQDLPKDVMAGFTVSVMQIPQGMAYALLSNIPPIAGLYMAFFPILAYVVLGTSHHISVGTFAVVSIMTGKVTAQDFPRDSDDVSSPSSSQFIQDSVFSTTEATQDPGLYSPLEIATALSFLVGVIQLAMGFLSMGPISLLLSPYLVSGFTTGAAVHVFTSQVKHVLGVDTERRNGLFRIPLTYYDTFSNITDCNYTAIIISVIAITSLIIYNELIKEWINKKFSLPIPIPIELLTIIIGTFVSYFMELNEKYEVKIVGEIPTGFPQPEFPPLKLAPDLIVDAVIISFVGYAVSVSMAKLFAKKHDYSIDPNQELIAQGAACLTGSFFSCAPVSASLSRSLVQESAGGKSLFTPLMSCGILACVLLWIGPLFENLPYCILASIIVVALKGMFKQALQLPSIFKECSIHGVVWVSSFLGVVILDIEYGLGIGIAISLLNLIWRSNRSTVSILGVLDDSDIYVDISEVMRARELPSIKIIKFTGSLNFATIENFIDSMQNIVTKEIKQLRKTSTQIQGAVNLGADFKSAEDIKGKDIEIELHPPSPLKCVILELSGVSSIDATAVKELKSLVSWLSNRSISLSLVACSYILLEQMAKSNFIRTVGTGHFFPTIQDAVVQHRLASKKE